MTTKSLKKITQILNRNEGFSIVVIIAIMIIMSVMGVVFSSIMGKWKLSAPAAINSSNAQYLAETAAMYALQDARYRFFSKNAAGTPIFPSSTSLTIGTRSSPFPVVNTTTESAEFWIERPYPSGNNTVDLVSGVDRGNDDDDNSSSDDDVVDDDLDDPGNPSLYTIIATGRTIRDGTTVAKRQLKVKADITKSPPSFLEPGVHTGGGIDGTGPVNNAHLEIDNATTGASVTYGNGTDNVTSGSESGPPGIIYRPAPPLDENIFKALAQDQGHYHSGDYAPSDNYPNGSYYFDTPTDTIPNIIFVEGNFTISGNRTIFGVYWIKGTTTVFNGNYQVNGIIISVGDITMNGGGTQTPNLNGGIIQYGAGNKLTGNGSPVDIDINVGFFNDLNNTLPIITVQSFQEAVSAN